MESLDKLSKSILFEFSSHGKTNYSCSLTSSTLFSADTTIAQLAVKLNSNEDNVRQAISFLTDLGYLTPFRISHSSAGKITLGVRLSHKGLHYRELCKLEKQKLLLKSVYLPILVSVVTTLTVLALQWLWPLLTRWLSSFHG